MYLLTFCLHFLTTHLARWLRTRRFSAPTFRSPRDTNMRKTQSFEWSLTFGHMDLLSSYRLSLTDSFFSDSLALLTLHTALVATVTKSEVRLSKLPSVTNKNPSWNLRSLWDWPSRFHQSPRMLRSDCVLQNKNFEKFWKERPKHIFLTIVQIAFTWCFPVLKICSRKVLPRNHRSSMREKCWFDFLDRLVCGVPCGKAFKYQTE